MASSGPLVYSTDHARGLQPQTLLFKAATGNAFTIVRAGRAFTRTVLPNMVLSVAFVAGFTRLLILQRPGNVNWPIVPISFVAIPARVLMTLDACLVFISNSPAIALTRAPFVIAFLPLAAFAAFIALGGSIFPSAGGVRGRQLEHRRRKRGC